MKKRHIISIMIWTLATCSMCYVVGSVQATNKIQRQAIDLDYARYNPKNKAFEFIEIRRADVKPEELVEDLKGRYSLIEAPAIQPKKENKK